MREGTPHWSGATGGWGSVDMLWQHSQDSWCTAQPSAGIKTAWESAAHNTDTAAVKPSSTVHTHWYRVNTLQSL